MHVTYCRIYKTKFEAILARVVLLGMISNVLTALSCTGTCRDEINRSVSCNQENFTEYDLRLLSPTIKPCGPSKPVDFKGTVSYPTDHQSAQLLYTWKSPDDSSVNDLIGFQITVGFPERSVKSPTRYLRIMFNNSTTARGWIIQSQVSANGKATLCHHGNVEVYHVSSYQLLCIYDEPSINVRVHATCMSLPICNNKYSEDNLSVNIREAPSTTIPTLNLPTGVSGSGLKKDSGSEQKSGSSQTIVAIITPIAAVVVITCLIWFIRRKVTRRSKDLGNTTEGGESTESRYSNIRYFNNTHETTNIAENERRSLHTGHNYYGENGTVDIQRYGLNEGMYSTVYTNDPCPIHGDHPSVVSDFSDNSNRYLPYTVSNRTDGGTYIHTSPNRTRSDNAVVPDTFLRETIPSRELTEGVYNPKLLRDSQSTTTTADSDEENEAYASTAIEEEFLRLNTDNL